MDTCIDAKIAKLRGIIPTVISRGDKFELPARLSELLHADSWAKADITFMNQLSRKVDISGRLYQMYDSDWRKVDDWQLEEPWVSITALQLLKLYCEEKANDASVGERLKRINTILKVMDLSTESWIVPGGDLRVSLEDELKSMCSLDTKTQSFTRAIASIQRPDNGGDARTIPLTVLFYEGPIARAYLETLKSLNMRAERIIHLISSRDVVTRKLVGRFLPRSMRLGYAANLQKNKIHYWPAKIVKDHPELAKIIRQEVNRKLAFDSEYLENAFGLRDLSTYSDEVETLLVEGLRDETLHQYLLQLPTTVLLFTGGGIVPPNLLSIEHLGFIHIHPGYLPDIRGADCVLWSNFITGHSSASCLYMAPGIDTGDIVKPCWLEPVNFAVDATDYDAKTLYRAVYAFFDPWVRAFVLREVLQQFGSFDKMPSASQNENDGLTYHFMHPILQKAALSTLFKKT